MQLAFATVGAVVGSYFGPLGTSIGWTIGSALGGALDPQKSQGPRLQDLHIQTSSYGYSYPFVWGTFRIGGNVNWKTDLEEHSHSAGGKGGPEVTNYTYTASYAVKICRRVPSSDTYRLLGVWSNGRWVYDNRTGTPSGDLPLVFYDGAEDQQPDPTQEGVEGADNVPADVGYLKAVYTDRELSEVGNVLPQDNYLISTKDADSDLSRTAAWEVVEVEPALRTNDRAVTYDPDALTVKVSRWITDGTIHGYTTNTNPATWETKTYELDGTLLDTFTLDHTFGNGNIYLCRNDSSLSFHRWTGMGTGNVSRWYKDGVLVIDTPVDGGIGDNFYGGMDSEFVFEPVSENIFALGGAPSTACYLIRYPCPGGIPNPTADAHVLVVSGSGGADQFNCSLGVDGYIYISGHNRLYKYDTDLTLVTTWVQSSSPSDPDRFPGHGASEIPNGKWMVCGGGDKFLVIDSFVGIDYHYALYQMSDTLPWTLLSSVLLVNSAEVGHAPIWSLGNGMALVEDGVLSVCVRSTGAALLSEIVADVCEMSGLTSSQYDVSQIPFRVRGFAACAEGPQSGRAILESILPAFFVDVGEWDGRIRFVPRGQPSAITIPDDDLAARSENGEPPSKLQIVIGNDLELPREIFIKYINPSADYQVGTQHWQRQNTDSKIVTTVSVPVVLTDDEAKRIVDAWGQTALLEKDSYTWYTTKKYLRYTETDVMTVRGIELRVTKKTVMMAENVIKWEGVRSRQGVFSQPGVGGEGGFVPPEIVEAQLTELAVIDAPFPEVGREGVITIGWQGAERRSWRGASLQKSSDGTTYAPLLTGTVPDTIGETTTALANFGGGYVFDEGPGVTVLIHPGGGELESVTRQAVLSGANLCMVGAEVIQFKTATLTDTNTYVLTGLLRGRRGTQWAMRGHAIGDRFIMLPTSVTIDALAVDYGRTRQYKAPTLGNTLASATAVPFRSNGVSVAPLSPVQLAAGFAGDPGSADITMRWRRRTRFGPGWINARSPTGQDSMPLGEATEAYRVRIFADGTFQTVVRTETVMDARSFSYAQAKQVEDFGAELLVLPAWSVAQIGALGPGYEMYSNGLGAALPLFIPTGTDGYVPPIPPPSEAIDDVMTWSEATTLHSGTFGPNDAWVIQFTTGSTDSGAGGLVRLQGAEFAGPPAPRQWTLSPVAGDFGPQSMPGAQGSGSPSVTALFVVGSGNDYGFYPTIPQSTTWYLNIRNQPSGYLDMPMFCTLLNVP